MDVDLRWAVISRAVNQICWVTMDIMTDTRHVWLMDLATVYRFLSGVLYSSVYVSSDFWISAWT